jgi:quercetin dioxygenase-like cupin family protein
MKNQETNQASRRSFLAGAPAAAAAGMLLARAAFAPRAADAEGTEKYQVFSADVLDAALKELKAKPGTKSLYLDKGNLAMLTYERAKSAKEFEWHEARDHVFYILEGETVYELGGTPKGAHQPRAHEWLAPQSEGFEKVALKKGDLISIPRGVLHRRVTSGEVSFLLITAIGEETVQSS